MTIKVELADGTTEIFKSQSYKISKTKDFHPAIVSVSVFDNGVRIKKVKRLSVFLYKHFTFKSKKVQEKLTQIVEAEAKVEAEKK